MSQCRVFFVFFLFFFFLFSFCEWQNKYISYFYAVKVFNLALERKCTLYHDWLILIVQCAYYLFSRVPYGQGRSTGVLLSHARPKWKLALHWRLPTGTFFQIPFKIITIIIKQILVSSFLVWRCTSLSQWRGRASSLLPLLSRGMLPSLPSTIAQNRTSFNINFNFWSTHWFYF
jgi:hypothetical protein